MLAAPIVNVLLPTVSKIVLSPAVKSKSVNAVKAVIVPPKVVAVPPMVIVLAANLATAIAAPLAILASTKPVTEFPLAAWTIVLP